MYKITSYPTKALIELELSGFWDADTFAKFRAEMQQHIERMPKTNGGYLCLTDARALNVQSRDIAENYAGFLTMPGVAAARTAIVATSPLLKLQARRAVATGDIEIFDDPEAARQWLFGKDVIT